MGKILSAKEVRHEIAQEIHMKVERFAKKGTKLCIALFRVGNNPDDISYQIGIEKKFKTYSMEVKNYVYEEDSNYEDFKSGILEASQSEDIQGILIFQPLPKNFHYDEIRNLIPKKKDMEGIGDGNIAALVTHHPANTYLAPLSIMKFLEFYQVDLVGKHVVVLGRGSTVGMPVSIMLIHAHATVSVCNSKTLNLREITKSADIIVSAMGRKLMIDESYVSPGQIVLDVGTIFEDGKLYGDVNVEAIKDIVAMVTPTPDGISSLTTDMLALSLLNSIR